MVKSRWDFVWIAFFFASSCLVWPRRLAKSKSVLNSISFAEEAFDSLNFMVDQYKDSFGNCSISLFRPKGRVESERGSPECSNKLLKQFLFISGAIPPR
jgi:hypothetical protein